MMHLFGKGRRGWISALVAVGLARSLPGAIVVVNLSQDANYQNQQAVAHLGGASGTITLPPITIGGASWTPQFNLGKSVGAFLNTTLTVSFFTGSPTTDIGYASNGFDADFPLGLAPGAVVDGSLSFTDPDASPQGLLTFFFSGDSTSQGNWVDGAQHYLPFALRDGGQVYYGFVGATVADYSSSSPLPSLSISGFAYETTLATPITVTAVPEPQVAALLFGTTAGVALWCRRKLSAKNV